MDGQHEAKGPDQQGGNPATARPILRVSQATGLDTLINDNHITLGRGDPPSVPNYRTNVPIPHAIPRFGQPKLEPHPDRQILQDCLGVSSCSSW